MELPSGNQRLARGVHYAEQTWLPINESAARAIRAGFQDGRYESNHSEFLSDLSRDPALYLFCLRKRAQQEKARDRERPEPWHSPEELLGPNSAADLREILTSPLELSCPHRLNAASPEQGMTLAHASTTAAVGCSLAKRAGCSETLTTAASFLRNVGLMLIAWNYPHIHKRVLATIEPDASLDQAFGLLLGFSPTLLGLNIARSWSLSPDVLIAMGDKMAEELASPELVARGKQLEALCQTGEAFARAMHPEHFPSADSDWRNATNEIRKILGPQGLAVVGRAVKDYLREYNCSLPEAFKIPERLAQEPQSAESAPQESLARNRYLQSCPPALRQALEEVYQHLRSQSVSRVPLEQLITVVIPRAGFARGCVYLFDHEHSCLRPRVAIGSAQINELVPIRCGLQPLERHALVEALLSGIPTELSASCFDGTPCDAFAGVLGGAQKTGVLYLEGGSALSNMTPQNRMGIFKALRQALNDALRIS